MLDFLVRSSGAQRLGRALMAGHNQRLGIRHTMRLAAGFNRLKNHRYHRLRKELYQRHLRELFEENGLPQSPVARMTDGWALDTARGLPYLEELVADSQEIIKARSGINRGGGSRSFFQQILTDEDIASYPSILDFATSSEVLQTVVEHMRLIPTLSLMKPLGVRLNESDQRFASSTSGDFAASQLFHRDYHSIPLVYVIVTLRDVTRDSGPFSFLPARVSARATDALGYGKRGRPYRVTDEVMYSIVEREDLVEFAYPAGTVLFVDSNLCFHYGSRNAVCPRYLMMFAYTPVYRCDFIDLIHTERSSPVLGDEARDFRSRYPIKPGGSRLRHLLLDRLYLGEPR